MSEKPLHVRVAEALGCEVLHKPEWDSTYPWFCGCAGAGHDGPESAGRIANYDTDWQDGGPLIEKYRIQLNAGLIGGHHSKPWYADLNHNSPVIENYEGEQEYGPTPLIAVCNLILALKEAGKLG